MSTTRITRILVGAILIVAAVLVLKAMGPQAAAVNTNMAPVGIGELRSYESSQGRISARAGFGDLRFYEASTGLAGGAVKGGSSGAGFGDLRFYEASTGLAGGAASGGSAGFGDLRLLEAQQSALSSSSGSYAGMGDLKLFEAHQNSTEL